jgi:phosphonate transport system permease protein
LTADAAPHFVERSWGGALSLTLRLVALLALALIVIQSALVVHARPQDLITGAYGMADIIRRAMPPDFGEVGKGVVADARNRGHCHLRHGGRGDPGAAAGDPRRRQRDSFPLALLRRAQSHRHRALGTGPGLGAALRHRGRAWAISRRAGAVVHSVGMLGRLFAETIEHMDMAPIDALSLTGARRLQVFTHGVIPSVLPSLLGIALYRLDENIRSSLVLGFVGAGGIGFELLSAMNLFQYQLVSLYLIVTFILVLA